ncbi:Protein of unknown function [Faunimonas pinastri]|uniref:DUF3168 domain-containing protein n=1 Tax=Faunimonas pinastri TaxID=1855383 RepID=A0A1H9MA06_9HYPH|nr:DUF3168 domain-containing protein [Faunimonas pinastri]SER19963.1 Protein of unknown function [Faunimonas pinastri]
MSGTFAGLALQKAVYAALSSDALLVTLLGGSRIYDEVPRNAAAPYVHLGEMTASDWSTSTEEGAEIAFAHAVWTRDPGRSSGLAIAERLVELLHEADLPLDGHRLVNLRHTKTETSRAEKPAGRRTLVRFRAVTEPQT